jgi:hypothetical protein
LFIRIDKEKGSRTLVWIYVDDSFLATTHPEERDRFRDMISQSFPLTWNYDVTSHLGINFTNHDDGCIKLSQPKLLQQLFDEYNTSNRSKYPASIRNERQISSNEDEPEIDDHIRSEYLHLMGKLNYLTYSRPDILTALSYSATKCKNPNDQDLQQLIQIVSYLKQTSDYGLTLFPRKENESTDIYLTAYVDAAYMSHTDASSHTGYCISLGSIQPSSYFYSKSSKQKNIATSSTHAEIRALYELTINIVYLLTLFEEIGRPIQLPALIFEDNQPTIDLVSSTTTKITKSKHYLMLIQYIREQCRQELIKLQKVATDHNISNILTKIITTPEFYSSFMKIMGLQTGTDELIGVCSD